MSEPAPMPEPLNDLIDDYLSGLLDEARLQELERRLSTDPEALRYFVRYASLDTDLHLEVRARQAGERALDRIDRLTQAGPARAGTGGRGARWHLVPRGVVQAAVTAACLL